MGSKFVSYRIPSVLTILSHEILLFNFHFGSQYLIPLCIWGILAVRVLHFYIFKSNYLGDYFPMLCNLHVLMMSFFFFKALYVKENVDCVHSGFGLQ